MAKDPKIGRREFLTVAGAAALAPAAPAAAQQVSATPSAAMAAATSPPVDEPLLTLTATQKGVAGALLTLDKSLVVSGFWTWAESDSTAAWNVAHAGPIT